MKDFKKLIWGVILIAAAVIIALNAFGVTDVDIWFPGWWTLFIIVPSLTGLFTERDKWGSLIGLVIGVTFLAWQLFELDFSLVWKLMLAEIIVVAAIKLIISGLGMKKRDDVFIKVNINGEIPAGTAIFGGKDMNFDGQVFDGAELTAIFGGVQCDLSRAIIEKDCKINATAIFGGVDIIVPRGVNVKVSSTNIFGGTSDECDKTPDAPVTIYIEAVSVFGGVDIK